MNEIPVSIKSDVDISSTDKIKLLIQEHHHQLLAFLVKRTNNIETARELAQDTYERLMKMDDFHNVSNPKAYLFQTASNLAVDTGRRETLHCAYLSREKKQHQAPEFNNQISPSTEHVVMSEERLRRLQNTVDSLPEKCRHTFLLHRLDNLTYPEIAEKMSISVSMVEKYIIQALKECRKCDRNDSNEQV